MSRYTLDAGLIMRTADLDLEDCPSVDVEDSEAVRKWAREHAADASTPNGEPVRYFDADHFEEAVDRWAEEFTNDDLADITNDLDQEFAALQ